MSDRYSYTNDRGRRDDGYPDRSDEWPDRDSSPRASSGAGAYSRSTRRANADYGSRTSARRQDDSVSQQYAREASSGASAASAGGQRSNRASSAGQRSTRSSSQQNARSRYNRSAYGSGSSRDDNLTTGERLATRRGDSSRRGGSNAAYRDDREGGRSRAAAASRDDARYRSDGQGRDDARYRTSESRRDDTRYRTSDASSRNASGASGVAAGARTRSGSYEDSRSGSRARSDEYRTSGRADARARSDEGARAGAQAGVSSASRQNPQARRGSAAAATASNPKRNIIIVAAVIVALLLVGGIAAFGYINSVTGNLHEGVDDDLRNALVETDMSKEPFYMLLLGTDKVSWREGTEEGGLYRSDTMILTRVDVPNGTISLVSIPRDTLVDMGEYGWQKINAAYGLGGPTLAVESVSKLTGVNISHYAEVDIDGMSAVVDAIGGIEVEVPIEIDDEDAGGYLAAGWQTLNGPQALILCRSRNAYIETSGAPDLMRAANQRMVLSAIAHKVLASDIATIAKTVSAVSSYVTTDLELNDIIGLAQALQGTDTDDAFYTAALPSHSAYVSNGHGYPDTVTTEWTDVVDRSVPEGWYGLIDTDDWNAMKKRMDEGKPPAEGLEIDEATGTVLSTAGSDAVDVSTKSCWISVMNGTDREGLGSRVQASLNAAGFENIVVDNAPDGYDYPETVIVYDNEGRARQAAQIAEAVGQGRVMLNDGDWIVANDFLVVIGDDWKTTSSSGSSASAG